MYKLLVILAASSTIIFGCNRKIVESSTVKESDSLSVSSSSVSDISKTEVKDTTRNIQLPVEKSSNEKVVTQDSGKVNSDTSKLETSTAISWAWIYDGRLFHWIKNKDSLKVNVPITKISNKHTDSKTQASESNKNTQETKTILIEKELKWWQKFLMWSGVAAWIFTLILIFKPKIINRG